MSEYTLSSATIIEYQGPKKKSVDYAIAALTRDFINRFNITANNLNQCTVSLVLSDNNNMEAEQFVLTEDVVNNQIIITASDDLGLIYGIYYFSAQYLGIDKFWFWNDTLPQKVDSIIIQCKTYYSKPAKVKYRGWFINDEVLIAKWEYQGNNLNVWKMAFEALMRCGGNMVIPGTDQIDPIYHDTAINMGLWVTHHHAEPLGAEMFSRAYPNLKPSFKEYQDKFMTLWETAVKEQAGQRIVWNIGFRGQGDRPFWDNDNNNQYVTSQQRGKVISDIIQLQYDLISKYVQDPVCCVNLYGEVAELYKEGCLQFPPHTIKIWADSGYGKMVSRRQGHHNPRVPALAQPNEKGPFGIYYHVTFYDLQASNSLTMLPNTPEFVNEELSDVLDHSMDDYWIVNCGNIRPHTYYLDLVAAIWQKGKINVDDFNQTYFSRNFPVYYQEMGNLYEDFQTAIIQYGVNDDERAGEELYYFATRLLIQQFIEDKTQSAKSLWWVTGDISFLDQINWFAKRCNEKLPLWESLEYRTKAIILKANSNANTSDESQRIFDQFYLQVKMHLVGCQSLILFKAVFEAINNQDEIKAFFLLGRIKELHQQVIQDMKRADHGKWIGYYDNDCQTNISLTESVIETMQKLIRVIGDGPSYHTWEKRYILDPVASKVVLLLHKEKHLDDNQLYRRLKDILDYPEYL